MTIIGDDNESYLLNDQTKCTTLYNSGLNSKYFAFDLPGNGDK